MMLFSDEDHTFTIRRAEGESLQSHLEQFHAAVQLAQDGLFSLYVDESPEFSIALSDVDENEPFPSLPTAEEELDSMYARFLEEQ